MANHRQVSTHSLPASSTNKLNPFYIEDDGDEETWDGDWRYAENSVDDGTQYEEAGLLDHDYEDDNGHRPSFVRRSRIPRGDTLSASPCRFRAMISFGVVILGFFLLLSSMPLGWNSWKNNPSENAAATLKSTNWTEKGAGILFDPVPSGAPTGVFERNYSNSSGRTNEEAAITKETNGINIGIRNTSSPPNHIILLGERLSGVDWWKDHLQTCFPKLQLQSRWIRPAPWFQTPSWNKSFSAPSWTAKANSGLVIYAVRDVFDWLRALYAQPVAMPSHSNISWHDFVTKSWTLDSATAVLNDLHRDDCQLSFSKSEVIPCQAVAGNDRLRNAVYELPPRQPGIDASAVIGDVPKPFANVFELRASKIQQVTNDFFQWFPGEYWYRPEREAPQVILAPYGSSLQSLLTQLQPILQLEAACDSPAMLSSRPPALPDSIPNIPDQHLETIREKVNWKVEALVGFNDAQ